jgi:DNA-binding winged helix-turn-helix (wHTH) protein/TolB-like protein/Flp pilus assembly protein TadD
VAIEARTAGIRIYEFANYQLDERTLELTSNHQKVDLEDRPLALLLHLVRHPGELLTKEQLLEAVWPGRILSESVLSKTMAKLRQALGDEDQHLIRTVYGQGYRLTAPVTILDPPAATNEQPPGQNNRTTPPQSASVHTTTATAPAAPDFSRTRRQWLLLSITGSVALLAGTTLLLRRKPLASAAAARPLRIPVLPFDDLSAGHIEGALANGLASDVISRFERIPQLEVAASGSAFPLEQGQHDAAELTALEKRLDAEYVVLGSVYRNRDRVRVAARLVRTANANVLWQDAFEQPLNQLGWIADSVAAATLASLGLPTSTRIPARTSQAYELHLLGEYAFASRTPEAIRKARDYFQHAIDLDPAYAPAYAGLAKTWLAEADYGFGLSAREAAARAQPLLDKAFTLDPDLLEGLIVQGILYTNASEFDRARTCLLRAVKLYPGSARAHFTLGVSYDFDTMVRPALESYTRAQALDRLNVLVDRRLGMCLMWLGRYDQAAQHFRRTLELVPKLAGGYWGLASLGYARGHYEESVRAYRAALDTDSRHPNLWNELAWLYMDLGMPHDAQSALDNQLQLEKNPAGALIDRAYLMLIEEGPTALSAFVKNNNLANNNDPGIAADALLLTAIAGAKVDPDTIDRNVARMKSDPTQAIGSYQLFLGHCTWLQYATLYWLAGRAAAADRLLIETENQLRRIVANGNIYHTIAYFEARIAALRGQPELALQRLKAAIAAGWRRGWWIRFDPAFRELRTRPELKMSLDQIDRDMTAQRQRLTSQGK